MNDAVPITELLNEFFGLILLSSRSRPDSLALVVAFICGLTLVAIHGSIAVRLIRMSVLIRKIVALYESGTRSGRDTLLRDLDLTFASSLLADSWSELMRRRRELEVHAPEDRAPIRLADLLVDRPLIPLGIRRRAMKALPILFGALGLASALGMLAGGLDSIAIGEPIASIISLALRGVLWGVIMATLAAALAAVLEGTADAQAAQLSLLVERSYRSLTPIEAQLRDAEAQRLSFERVSSLLVQVAQDLRDSLDRGLGRIERSTANAANLVGEEQRRKLELVIEDLSGLLRRGVEDQLGALRTALQRAADQQEILGAHIVSTTDQIAASAESNTRVSGTLERAAQAVDEAASTMAGSAGELKPLIVHLGAVAATLELAAGRVEQTQTLTSPGDDGVSAMLSGLRERLDELCAATPLKPVDFEPELEPPVTSARRGGDLASALARSGDALEPAGELDGAPTARGSDAPSLSPPPVSHSDETSELDFEPVGRGGFSALLSRYKAPQFSIDELSPNLREFNADQAAERARTNDLRESTDPADLLDQAAVAEPDPGSAYSDSMPEDETNLDSEAEGLSSEETGRRGRLHRFLGTRDSNGSDR